jgi:hypothetical protein
MVSGKGILKPKKASTKFSQAIKKWLDAFYAKAAKDGRNPSPLEAMQALGRNFEAATEGEYPPQPHPLSDNEFQALLSPALIRHAYVDAADAQVRYTLGLEIKKRKPGRKVETALAERIWKLKAEGKTVPQIQAIFRAEDQHFSREKIESYLKTRRKSPR